VIAGPSPESKAQSPKSGIAAKWLWTLDFRLWTSIAMLSVEDALKLVLERGEPLRPIVTSVGNALGCMLAEEVVSDIDSPPHDKAIVDGYALISADIQAAGVELSV